MSARAGNFLARMAASSRVRADAAEARRPAEPLARRASQLPPPPPLRLSPQGFDLIAEVKRRSPSAGNLAASALRIAAQARNYVQGGAAALSVLTEPEEFAGDLAHLKEVAAAAHRCPPCARTSWCRPTSCWRPAWPAPAACCSSRRCWATVSFGRCSAPRTSSASSRSSRSSTSRTWTGPWPSSGPPAPPSRTAAAGRCSA